MLLVTFYVAVFERELKPPLLSGPRPESVTLVTKEIHSELTQVLETESSIKDSYILLGKVMKLRPVHVACFVLLTCRIAFAATSSASMLKVNYMSA